MIGILCEKPSAGRNFAAALGGATGTYNGEQYVITAARGHLYEYVEPSAQVAPALAKKYKDWSLVNLPWNENDFQWKRQKKDGVQATLTQIKNVLSKCDEIVIATDVDPTGEGELLAWEILDELKLRPKKFSRMYFMDEAEKSIRKAFVDRKVLPSMLQDMDYVKATYRSQWDMLSMQFTRIATHCVGGSAVLRQGRLKSYMVTLVGQGWDAYNNYKKLPEYTNKFKDNHGVVYTNPQEPRFKKESDVPNSYHDSDVVCDSKTMKRKAPPKLIDVAALSATLASKGYTAKEVLAVYQKMYEAKIVSYPRTEDKVITPEQFNELLPLVDDIAAVVGVDASILTHRSSRSTHVKTGGAHGANRPGTNVPKRLDDLVSYGACGPLIYETLARNYLAMIAEDYEYEQQKGHIKEYPLFVGSTAVPKSMGWKAVYQDDMDDDDDDTSTGLGTTAAPYVAEIVNPRPPKPTMKWLMKQLESRDVGTGATRTSTYADVTNSKAKYPLLVDKKGVITMSPYGSMSYVLLEGTHIGDAKVTESLMQEMRDIADGVVKPEACLARIQDMVRHDMQVMQKNKANLAKLGDKIMSKAPQQNYEVKEKYEGTWNGKEVKFTRTWGGHTFTDEECEELLAGKEIEVLGLKSKTGNEYGVTGKLTKQSFNGHSYVGFERTGFAGGGSKQKGVPDEFSGYKFSDDEKCMLEAGKELFIEGCISKKTGSAYSCHVTYGKNDRGYMAIIPNFKK